MAGCSSLVQPCFYSDLKIQKLSSLQDNVGAREIAVVKAPEGQGLEEPRFIGF